MAYTVSSFPASSNRQKSFQADGSRQKNAGFQTGKSGRKVTDEGDIFNVPVLILKSSSISFRPLPLVSNSVFWWKQKLRLVFSDWMRQFKNRRLREPCIWAGTSEKPLFWMLGGDRWSASARTSGSVITSIQSFEVSGRSMVMQSPVFERQQVENLSLAYFVSVRKIKIYLQEYWVPAALWEIRYLHYWASC